MLHLDSRLGKAGACLLACLTLATACDTLPTASPEASTSRPSPYGIKASADLLTTGTVTTGTVTRVAVSFVSGNFIGSNRSLPVGGSEQFAAIAYDSAGRKIAGRVERFSSSNPSVLAIDSISGVATALKTGYADVWAKVDGVSGHTGQFAISGTLNVTAAPVARVTVAAVSGSMDSTGTLTAGGTEQFKATAYDSTGAVVSNVTAKYVSTNSSALAVDSVTGAATAVAAGTAAVTATISGVAGTSSTITVVAAPAPAPAPPPPPTPAGSVALTVVRFDGQSGAATVSNGVPLAPGALFPGAESQVRVFVGGVEQAAYVTGLASLHPDGSLRAVLVQFSVPSLGATQTLSGTLTIGSARPAAMTLASPLVTPGTLVAGTPAGLPQAAALPTDPVYLIATDLVGQTTTAAANNALSGVYSRYESDFVKYSSSYWTSEGASWVGDYYDRALIYYAMWVRTGNPTYWARAGRIAYDYRTKYVEANSYNVSPHWAQLEGLEKHYLAGGDDKSRFAVGRVANVLNGYIPSNYMTRVGGDSRIAARVLHAQLLAWRLTPAGQTLASNSGTTYGTRVETVLTKLVAWQQANGSYPADGVVCGGQLNYMVGLLNDALIKAYDYYVPATTPRTTLQGTMQTLVQKAADYMWTTQWLAANRAFKYASVTCTGVGGPSAAPDLNNMIASGFGWLYKRTGNAQYLTNGDAIFAGGVTQAYLGGSKQFNEEYTSSFRYLGYR